MPSVLIVNGLQINGAKRKCQECLHGHSLRSCLFWEYHASRKKYFVVIVRSVYDFHVIAIHGVIMLINKLGSL